MVKNRKFGHQEEVPCQSCEPIFRAVRCDPFLPTPREPRLVLPENSEDYGKSRNEDPQFQDLRPDGKSSTRETSGKAGGLMGWALEGDPNSNSRINDMKTIVREISIVLDSFV